jgi:tetratricopeptide (TPR) repeat protein
MRSRSFIVLITALGLSLPGCAPTKEGVKNRQAAADRMNIVSAQVNLDQAKQLFATGQLDKALSEVDKAIARYPESGKYHLLRGRILLEQARLEQSLHSFTTALQKDPTLADAQYYAGVVYQRWSDDEQAYNCYKEACAIAPDQVHYLLAAAESLVAMGELEQADALIEPKLAYFEHNASLRQLRAQIAMLRGDAAQAAALYVDARMLNPDDETVLEELLWAQYAANMFSECYDSARTLQIMAKEPRQELTLLEARCLAMMGRGVEARELYLQLTNLRPGDIAVWSELGTLSWELGDYRSLAQASVQLTAMAPHRYEGYLFRAVNERHKGNTAEAVRLLREACDRAGDATLPFLMLGQALEQTGDLNGAVAAYNAALTTDPDSAQAKTLLGRLNGERQITAAPVE